jgi:drug/metabolite transporter (DMT)-like permease
MRLAGALLLAIATAILYALSTSLQALEARRTSPDVALRASLIGRLARSRLWLAATLAGLLAWPMQAAALALGSVALVQPTLAIGLVALLVLGVLVLHERVGIREAAGAAAIAAGVAVLAWAAAAANGGFGLGAQIAIVVAAGAVAAAPSVARRTRAVAGLAAAALAGVGWGVVGFVTALLDESVAHRDWTAIAGWLACVGAASWSSLVLEMTALQTAPATRAIPLAFAIETTMPAALAPLLTSARPANAAGFAVGLALAAAGAVALGRSPVVADVVRAGPGPLTGP